MLGNNSFPATPVVKNLLIINTLFFMATALLNSGIGGWMMQNLALYYWESPLFRPYQLVTHMFLHAGFAHFFFNMFALWMFGRVIEYDLGSRRFLVYYFVCGIGAALLQLGVNWIEVANLKSNLAAMPGSVEIQTALWRNIMTPMVGASGAIFGLLLAFGMFHPNSVIMLLFPPIPLKAKYFVIIYGLIELFAGVTGRSQGVAHFAHVGGLVLGLLLILWWKHKRVIY